MNWYDWLIALIPSLIVLGVGLYSSEYGKGVVFFQSAEQLSQDHHLRRVFHKLQKRQKNLFPISPRRLEKLSMEIILWVETPWLHY